MSEEKTPLELLTNAAQASSSQQETQPGDFYMEGPYMVFTEQYHLRRGYCCNSSCRHCPYR